MAGPHAGTGTGVAWGKGVERAGKAGAVVMRTVQERRDYQRAWYRRTRGSVKQVHPIHRCGICSQPNHNARSCTACCECAGYGEFQTNHGRLCRKCMDRIAEVAA